MRTLLVLGSLVALLAPVASQAQPSLALRVGYAPAMGDAAKDVDLKESALTAQIPLQLDALYGIDANIAVGAYLAYGFGRTDPGLFAEAAGQRLCDRDPGGNGTIECSGSSIRFGAQGIYTFQQVKWALVPWAGLSVGYESVSVEAKDSTDALTLELNGFDLGLQVGADTPVGERFAVGPYLTFHVGQYRTADFRSTVAPTENTSGSIDDKALHLWFGVGIRGKLHL